MEPRRPYSSDVSDGSWKTRFRRLVRDYERRLTTLVGLHYVAFACLEFHRAVPPLPEVHDSL